MGRPRGVDAPTAPRSRPRCIPRLRRPYIINNSLFPESQVGIQAFETRPLGEFELPGSAAALAGMWGAGSAIVDAIGAPAAPPPSPAA